MIRYHPRPGFLFLGWLVLCCLGLAGCQSQAAEFEAPVAPSERPSDSDSRTISAAQTTAPGMTAPDPAAIPAVWQDSAHADTFVVDEAGTNSSCARCHAPANWMPSMEDMPESCYACKFEVKPPPPYVEEDAWAHVECKVCHREKKGEVQPEVVWLEIPPIEEYREVQAAHEVCQQCHQAVDVPGHAGVQAAGAHASLVCTECHDSHSLKSGCERSGCHPALEGSPPAIPGHDQEHAGVSCPACHSAGEITVGPDEAGQWITWKPASQAGDESPVAFTSHDIVRQAPCERCHYADNPWQLSVQASEANP